MVFHLCDNVCYSYTFNFASYQYSNTTLEKTFHKLSIVVVVVVAFKEGVGGLIIIFSTIVTQ